MGPPPGAVDVVVLELAGLGAAVLFLVVAVGAIAQFLPTAGLVSATAAAAATSPDPVPYLLLVLAAAAGGAFVGDAVLHAVLTRSGGRIERLTRRFAHRFVDRLVLRSDPRRIEDVQRRLVRHAFAVLAVTRFVPGGRIPVAAVAVPAGLRKRRFLVGNALAALLWAGVYTLLGLVSAGLFPSPWQAVTAAVVLVVVVTVGLALGRRLLRARTGVRTDARTEARDG
jgi:membrane protein DedA with SNARE-associated domain